MPFLRLFFLGVLFGLLLCPPVCLRLLRTRSLSAFCAIPSTRLLAQALGVCFAWLCSWLWVLRLWVGGLFLPVLVFLPPFVPPAPLGVRHSIRFCFFGLCFCPGVLWLGVGGDQALLCMVFLLLFCCCSVFFSFQDPTTAKDEERTPESGAAQWWGWLEGLLASSTQ